MNYTLYMFLKVIAIVIVFFSVFTVYVGTMWNFDNLEWHEKVLGLSYIVILIVLVFLKPQKNLVYFSMLLVGTIPFIYWIIKSFLDYNKLFDILFPSISILAFIILFFLSFQHINKE